MVDIRRKNFSEHLEQVKEAIETCSFLAFDTELTGLDSARSNVVVSTDSIEERYTKMKDSTQAFLISQYGISTFHFVNDRWEAKTFNFWIFPVPYAWNDKVFRCQSSSLQFLTEHNFDFNAFIYEGIGYLNQEEREKLRPKMSEWKPSLDNPIVLIKPADIEHGREMMKLIKQWMENPAEKELTLPPCNSWFRAYFFQQMERNYPNTIYKETVRDSCRFTKISSEQERTQKIHETFKASLDAYDAAVGFSRVMDFIIASKKLVLGHNLFFDLLHTYDKFVRPLPPTMKEWKLQLNSLFPKILDTKYLALKSPRMGLVGATSLGELYDHFIAQPKLAPNIVHAEKFTLYNDSRHAHQAGFDAYMTGFIFLKMLYQLEQGPIPRSPTEQQNHQNQQAVTKMIDVNTTQSLEPFINRLHLMKADVSLNLLSPQEEPSYYTQLSASRSWQKYALLGFFALQFAGLFVASRKQ